MDPLTTVSTRVTPQHRPADERQTPNAAGGYGFAVDADTRVRRFLTLGTDGGTYYATERALTAGAAAVVLDAARERGTWLVEQVRDVSLAGRAPRQNPALFALAAAAALSDDDGRAAALAAVADVCRTGTHLFTFAGYAEQFRGWGRGLRRAVGAWYSDRDADALAYQVLKYRQRDGWSHRDLLRLSHPRVTDPSARDLLGWVVSGRAGDAVPSLVRAFAEVQATDDVRTWVRAIERHPLSWEMLPDAALSEPRVWAALLERGLPQTALLRQLPRLTRLGVLGFRARRRVAAQLADPERLRAARVHPVNVLVAQRTYASGRSVRGDASWTPVPSIVDALDAAFSASFGAVRPSGTRTLLALDVSGSMTQPVSGLPISCREASAALALVTMATEPSVTCVGFTSGTGRASFDEPAVLAELPLSPRRRLDDNLATVSALPFGGTDCALPMTWAAEHGHGFDTFVVLTDNETWAGGIHPHQALARYRERVVPHARLVVVGMTATDVSIADPDDAGMLDVAGFDAAAPQLVADFARGDV